MYVGIETSVRQYAALTGGIERLRSRWHLTYQTVPELWRWRPAGPEGAKTGWLGSRGAWIGFRVAVDDGSQIDLADAAVTIKHPSTSLSPLQLISSSSSHFIPAVLPCPIPTPRQLSLPTSFARTALLCR